MILYKSRLITDAVAGILKAVIKIIYKILKVLNLRLLALLALAGLVFYFTGLFEDVIVLAVFVAVALVCLGFNLAAKVEKLFSIGKKNKGGGVQMVSNRLPQNVGADSSVPPQKHVSDYNGNEAGYTNEEARTEVKNYPIYYKVRNSSCVMAEFEDRYELYIKTANGLKRVRTDYKE